MSTSADYHIRKCFPAYRVPSARTGTTLEEDRAELELVGEIWCRLGKERLKRGMIREVEECCGYVTELLPKVKRVLRVGYSKESPNKAV